MTTDRITVEFLSKLGKKLLGLFLLGVKLLVRYIKMEHGVTLMYVIFVYQMTYLLLGHAFPMGKNN